MDTTPQEAQVIQKGPAVRKRSQIAEAGKTMFIWVAVSSLIIGGALVGSIFLTQRLFFNQRVINEKTTTITALDTDNKNVKTLENNVAALETNQSLIGLKAHPDDNAVQVILDALPSDANSAALGGSLQNLLNVPGLSIISLAVDPVEGVEVGIGTGVSPTTAAPTADGQPQSAITFSLQVTGSQDAIKQLLTNFEKSIRTIDVQMIKIEATSDSSGIQLTLNGQAYYQPAATIKLEDKEVK